MQKICFRRPCKSIHVIFWTITQVTGKSGLQITTSLLRTCSSPQPQMWRQCGGRKEVSHSIFTKSSDKEGQPILLRNVRTDEEKLPLKTSQDTSVDLAKLWKWLLPSCGGMSWFWNWASNHAIPKAQISNSIVKYELYTTFQFFITTICYN